MGPTCVFLGRSCGEADLLCPSIKRRMQERSAQILTTATTITFVTNIAKLVDGPYHSLGTSRASTVSVFSNDVRIASERGTEND